MEGLTASPRNTQLIPELGVGPTMPVVGGVLQEGGVGKGAEQLQRTRSCTVDGYVSLCVGYVFRPDQGGP